MSLATPFHVRDSVHGLVPLTDTEMRALNTPEFQRLHHLSVSALQKYVYPSCTASQFSHSIGRLAVIDRILSSSPIELGSDETIPLRLAALLQSVADPPFFSMIRLWDERADGYRRTALESIWRNGGSVHNHDDEESLACVLDAGLSAEQYATLKDILFDPTNRLNGFFSAPVNVSLIDRMARDAQQAGFPSLQPDPGIYSAFVLDQHSDSERIAFRNRPRFLSILELFLQSFYQMTHVVWNHHVVLGALEMFRYVLLPYIQQNPLESLRTLGDDHLLFAIKHRTSEVVHPNGAKYPGLARSITPQEALQLIERRVFLKRFFAVSATQDIGRAILQDIQLQGDRYLSELRSELTRGLRTGDELWEHEPWIEFAHPIGNENFGEMPFEGGLSLAEVLEEGTVSPETGLSTEWLEQKHSEIRKLVAFVNTDDVALRTAMGSILAAKLETTGSYVVRRRDLPMSLIEAEKTQRIFQGRPKLKGVLQVLLAKSAISPNTGLSQKDLHDETGIPVGSISAMLQELQDLFNEPTITVIGRGVKVTAGRKVRSYFVNRTYVDLLSDRYGASETGVGP